MYCIDCGAVCADAALKEKERSKSPKSRVSAAISGRPRPRKVRRKMCGLDVWCKNKSISPMKRFTDVLKSNLRG